MVERSLRMREARGSIPRTSIIFHFAGESVILLRILLVGFGMVFDVWCLAYRLP